MILSFCCCNPSGPIYISCYKFLDHQLYPIALCSRQVFTWGHRLVTPKRVVIARNLRKVGSTLLKFHRKERLHVVAIAAGMTHSMALMDDGALFFWVSSDPDLHCQQVYVMSLSLFFLSIV